MQTPDPPERYTRAVYLRLRPSTYAAAELVAQQNGRPVNRMVDILIREALDARKQARLDRARRVAEEKARRKRHAVDDSWHERNNSDDLS